MLAVVVKEVVVVVLTDGMERNQEHAQETIPKSPTRPHFLTYRNLTTATFSSLSNSGLSDLFASLFVFWCLSFIFSMTYLSSAPLFASFVFWLLFPYCGS